MNNEQFRKLVQNTPARQDGANGSPQPGATPSMLGSKRSSFVPMTPRSVRGGAGNDFARQVAERNAANQQSKKFRSTAAPKGSRLATGYNDRTQERWDLDSDEKGARIKALEEQMKLGQLDQNVFEALRDQITGGDISATHLVKGLDRKLLERVRKGEDVMGAGQKSNDEDFDEEFEKLEEKDIAPIQRERQVKKGDMAPPPPIAGAKRSRDAILAELKAQRKAQAEARIAARPELGDKFRDVGASRAGPHVERDEKGREVLITVDEHGNVKKKVRKFQPTGLTKHTPAAPDQPAKYLDEGITVPTAQPAKKEAALEEDSDDEIFEGAGTSYDPLAGMDDDDGSSSDEEEESAKPSETARVQGEESLNPSNPPHIEQGEITSPMKPTLSPSPSPLSDTDADAEADAKAMPPPPRSDTKAMPPPPPPTAPRNYFASTTSTSTTLEAEAPSQSPFNDAAFLAAIKKAGALSNISLSLGGEGQGEDDQDAEAKEARLKRRAQMLETNDRDFQDMDLGFGSSRFGDEEDDGEGGSKIKLSQWKGSADDDGDDGDGRGAKGGDGKRKRNRKRKGDKNSAQDVLGVMQRRKEGAAK